VRLQINGNVRDEYRYICTLEGVQLHGSRGLIEETEALKRLAVRQKPLQVNGREHAMSSSDSSFSSSFSSFSGAAGPASVAPPATAAGAGPPPPEPTFNSSSFTFLPSRAFESNAAHMGSTSTPAAFVRAVILSVCGVQIQELC